MTTTTTKYQNGVTLLGWVFVIALIMFFMLLGFRLIPLYYESYAVGRALQEVADDPSISMNNAVEVRKSLQKRLNINEIDTVEASDLEIEKVKDKWKLSLEYQNEVPFMGNLYLTGKFEKTATASR